MAQESASMCPNSMSGYSFATRSATMRHSREVAMTFALSTEVTFLRRPFANSKAARTARSISCSVLKTNKLRKNLM